MSAETIQRILERTLPQVAPACLKGRGEELLLSYCKAIAEDFAATCFLKAGEIAARADAEGVGPNEVWPQLNTFYEASAESLLESVRATFNRLGAADSLEMVRAGKATAIAFFNRLEFLMEASGPGGSA